MARSEILFRYLSGGTKEDHKKILFRIVDASAEIRTGLLSNLSQALGSEPRLPASRRSLSEGKQLTLLQLSTLGLPDK
jgi:hypothetical protein